MRIIKTLFVLGLCFCLLSGFTIEKNTTVIVGDSIMARLDGQKGLSGIILEDMTSYLVNAQEREDFINIGGSSLEYHPGKSWAVDNCTANMVGYSCIENWKPELLIVEIGFNDIALLYEYGNIANLVSRYRVWYEKLLSVANGNPNLKIIQIFVHPAALANCGPTDNETCSIVENPVEMSCGGFWSCLSAHHSNYMVWKEQMKVVLAELGIPYIDVFQKVLDDPLYGPTADGLNNFAADFLGDFIHIVTDVQNQLYYDRYLREDLHDFYASNFTGDFIAGKVSGDLLENVMISLYEVKCSDNTLLDSTWTDDEGRYNFFDLTAGGYLVEPQSDDCTFGPSDYSTMIPLEEFISIDFTAECSP